MGWRDEQRERLLVVRVGSRALVPSLTGRTKPERHRAARSRRQGLTPHPSLWLHKMYRAWQDIPQWCTERSFLFELPIELLDRIFGIDSGLELYDHVAMSGVCRAIRMAYTDDVWRALLHPYEVTMACHQIVQILNNIFTSAEARSRPQRPSADTRGIPLRISETPSGLSPPRDMVVSRVNSETILHVNAKSVWKLTDDELDTIPFTLRPDPHHAGTTPLKLYKVARVRALALRLHGGLLEHLRLVGESDSADDAWTASGRPRKKSKTKLMSVEL